MVWRSRNPVARAFDIVSEVRHDLPDSVRLVALELGVKEAIAELAPLNLSVVTLEHPILTSEWSESPPPRTDRKVKIGFLGNARKSKGFEVFVNLANSADRDDIAFEAIGIAAPDTDHLDLKALSRVPSRKPLSRDDYLACTRDLDLVCLPLHGRAYDFTASGTVADAVAALKPLLAFRSRTLDAIVARYGPIGWLVESEAELTYLVQTFDRATFDAHCPLWIANLRKIRDARRPEALARSYGRLVTETPCAA
jgi:glycosyltransferase involved in cell wall biosynthesis